MLNDPKTYTFPSHQVFDGREPYTDAEPTKNVFPSHRVFVGRTSTSRATMTGYHVSIPPCSRRAKSVPSAQVGSSPVSIPPCSHRTRTLPSSSIPGPRFHPTGFSPNTGVRRGGSEGRTKFPSHRVLVEPTRTAHPAPCQPEFPSHHVLVDPSPAGALGSQRGLVSIPSCSCRPPPPPGGGPFLYHPFPSHHVLVDPGFPRWRETASVGAAVGSGVVGPVIE